jgi:preprotein translocase subunit SecG
MTTVLLIIHLLTALSLVGLILMQQSEGGVLGVGGGSNSLFTARGASNVLSRGTAILAGIFFVTSLSLTLLAGSAKPKSVVDTVKDSAVAPLIPLRKSEPAAPVLPAAPANAPSQPAEGAPALRPLPDLATDAPAPAKAN